MIWAIFMENVVLVCIFWMALRRVDKTSFAQPQNMEEWYRGNCFEEEDLFEENKKFSSLDDKWSLQIRVQRKKWIKKTSPSNTKNNNISWNGIAGDISGRFTWWCFLKMSLKPGTFNESPRKKRFKIEESLNELNFQEKRKPMLWIIIQSIRNNQVHYSLDLKAPWRRGVSLGWLCPGGWQKHPSSLWFPIFLINHGRCKVLWVTPHLQRFL